MPEAGNVLDGRYLLQEPIGSGGVAHVFKALHYRVRRQVAVKLLHQTTLGEHSLAPRFEHEALALAQLSHPNIVRLQDYGVTSGVQYLVMELVDGRTLREALEQDGAFAVDRALSLTRQLLHALAYAHERGIVHRDLKPLNLVVQALPHQPEHLKVLDFGFAKFLPASDLHRGAPVTHAGFAFGSPTYISPEQCTGDTVDGRADLYSVGVLLFEMLTGMPPFSGEVPELLRHHLQSPVPRIAALRPELADSAQLQAVLDRALAKPRDERYASAGDFLAALDTLQRASVVPHAVSGRELAVRYAAAGWQHVQIGSRYVWTRAKHAWRVHVRPTSLRAAELAAQHARSGFERARPIVLHWYQRAKDTVARRR
jgi:eukaryotic-like serine/threonine-protein kinase